MVFWLPFGLNNKYRKNFKGDAPPLIEVGRELSPLTTHEKCGLSDPTHMLCWLAEAFPLLQKTEIVGVVGANMQWGHFVYHSSSQKRESIALDLILQSN